MKKFMLMAALVAVVVAALALPALAHDRFSNADSRFEQRQARLVNFWDRFYHNNWWDNNNEDTNNVAPAVSQNVGGQEAQSGDVYQQFSASNTGDNSNQCASAMQFGNTGNNQNSQGVIQSGSQSGDVEFSGGSFNFAPTNVQSCDQKVQQSAAATSYGWK